METLQASVQPQIRRAPRACVTLSPGAFAVPVGAAGVDDHPQLATPLLSHEETEPMNNRCESGNPSSVRPSLPGRLGRIATKQITTGFKKWAERYIAACSGQKKHNYQFRRMEKWNNILQAHDRVEEE